MMKHKAFLYTFVMLTIACLLLGPGVASAGTTPGITFTSPKSSDVIVVGSTVKVTWKWNGDPGLLKFEMVDVNGFVRDYIAVNMGTSTTSLLWSVRVRDDYNWYARHKIVARTMNGNKFVAESAHFAIQAPEINVSLSGGPVWPAGVTNKISWSPKTLPGNGKIELVRKSDYQAVQVLATSVPFKQGYFNWAPPKTLPAAYDGKEFIIRVWSDAAGTWGDSGAFKLDL